MKSLKIKVCGMRDPENIQGVLALKPDFIGFIFYPKSQRFVGKMDERLMRQIPSTSKKVGVFVNASLAYIMDCVERYTLDYVQLHGDETLSFVKELRRKGIRIIKVFRISGRIPLEVERFIGMVDYFLFDTDTATYGGSGLQFDWNILNSYAHDVPFILSGGLRLSDVTAIQSLQMDQLVGIDVNSRFEVSPGLKDLQQIQQLTSSI